MKKSEVEVKNVKLTTVEADFIALWLDHKRNKEINQTVESVMKDIVKQFEKAPATDNYSVSKKMLFFGKLKKSILRRSLK